MNREGSTEEEMKFMPHSEKKLPLKDKGGAHQEKCKFKSTEKEQVWFVRGTSRGPSWLESRARSAR